MRMQFLSPRNTRNNTKNNLLNFVPFRVFRGLILISYFLFPISIFADNFLWNQANTRMMSASQPSDFAEAATIYRSLIDRGEHSPQLFYNYGTALLLADAPDAAIDALLRAERYGGSNPDIRRNLDLAITKAKAQPEWYRVPLFWHYALSLQTRFIIASIAFNSFFLFLLIRILIHHPSSWLRFLFILCFIIFALFGSSALFSWHQNTLPLPTPVYAWGENNE